MRAEVGRRKASFVSTSAALSTFPKEEEFLPACLELFGSQPLLAGVL